MPKEKLTLLDLFCGAGGASMGYHQAGFEVVGVDIKPQPRYPFEFHQADALNYPLDGFDVIHASPPCQAYTRTNAAHRYKHLDLINITRKRIKSKPYIIENVQEARHLLKQPIMLCGSMFNLPIQRHRYFEIHPLVMFLMPSCNHKPNTVYITGTPRPKDGSPRKDPPAAVRREAMETPWMTIKNMDEAIPPTYTKFIGEHLIKNIAKGHP